VKSAGASWFFYFEVTKAIAHRVNPFTLVQKPNLRADALLRRSDCIAIEHHPDFPAKQIQQDRNPVTVRYPFVQVGICGERALDDADLAAAVKLWWEIELDDPGVIMPALQFVD